MPTNSEEEVEVEDDDSDDGDEDDFVDLDTTTIRADRAFILPPELLRNVERRLSSSEQRREEAHRAETQTISRNLATGLGRTAVPGLHPVPSGDSDSQCYSCRNYFNSRSRPHFSFITLRNGERICGHCVQHYSRCQECENSMLSSDTLPLATGDRCCLECARRNGRFYCRGCRHLTETNASVNTLRGLPYCRACYQFRRSSATLRDSSSTYRPCDIQSDKFISAPKKGAKNIITSSRIFSTEIECYPPSGDTRDLVCRKRIPSEMGVSGDGSLNSGGIELQTPRLGGEKGEKILREICSNLITNDFYTDEKCGLHIHLDGGSKLINRTNPLENPTRLKSLWKFYLVFEDVILSFLPRTRRGNKYCRQMKWEFHVREIEACATLYAIEQLWYRRSAKEDIERLKSERYADNRYQGINLHSLIGHNHMEVRYHSGTINAEKMLHWVALHSRIMDSAEASQIPDNIANLVAECITIEEKTELFFAILKLPEETKKYLISRAAKFLSKEPHGEDDLILQP